MKEVAEGIIVDGILMQIPKLVRILFIKDVMATETISLHKKIVKTHV